MKVSVDIPDEAKPVLDELLMVHEKDGLHTYKDICDMAVEWYLRTYVDVRNAKAREVLEQHVREGTEGTVEFITKEVNEYQPEAKGERQ